MARVELAAARDTARLAGGAAQSIGGRLAGRALNFASHLLLARALGPAGLGLYALGWAIAQIGVMVVSLGLHNGVVFFGSRLGRADTSGRGPLVRRSLALALGAATAAGAALWLAAPRLTEALAGGDPALVLVLRWLAAGLPLATGLKVAAAATRVSQRMVYSVLSEELGQPATHLVLLATLLAAGAGLAGAVGAVVASFAAGLAIAAWGLSRVLRADPSGRSVGHDDAPGSGKLLRYSLPTAVAGVLAVALLWVDRLLLGHFLDPSDVGVYQAAAQAALVFQLILAGINAMFAPMIAEHHARRQHARLQELYRVGTKWALYLTLPLLVTAVLVPEAVMATLFGAPYAAGALPLRILAVGQLFNVATGAVGYLLIMTGRQTRWLAYSAAVLGINLALNLALIPRLGLAGAALATAVAVAALFLLGLAGVKFSLGLWPWDGRSWKLAAGTVGAGLAVVGIRLLPIHSPPAILASALLGASLVFGSVLAVSPRDPEDAEILARAWRARPRARQESR